MFLAAPHRPSMRGSDHLKKILASNNETKSMLLKSYTVYFILTAAIYCYKRVPAIIFILSSIPDSIAVFMLHKISVPLIIIENGAEKLVSVTSLNSPGVPAFYFDVLFWGMLVRLLLAFNWKWSLLYVGIPVSFGFEFFYKPYKNLTKRR